MNQQFKTSPTPPPHTPQCVSRSEKGENDVWQSIETEVFSKTRLSRIEELKQKSGLLRSFNSLVMTQKSAFTLAETLITLVIIGVVAALTVPNMITNYQKEVTVNRLKKAYSELAQGVKLAEMREGELKNWDYSLSSKEFIDRYFVPYIKLDATNANQLNKELKYTHLDGTNVYNSINTSQNTIIYRLSNGSFLFIDGWHSSTEKRQGVLIDINGAAKPNRYGRDLFSINIHSQYGVVPYYFNLSKEDILTSYCTKSKGGYDAGTGCLALIMKDGWKISDDYPW